MFKFTPKNSKFYDHFDRASDITLQAAEAFHAFVSDFKEPDRHAVEIKKLESQVDEVVHQTMELLHRSFITPFERGDIRMLVEALDNVIDLIHAAATRLALYEIDRILPEAPRLAKVLVDAAREVREAVHLVRTIHDRESILGHCIEINRLEDSGDVIYREALASLFKSGADPLDVIKWREIFDHIESSIDRCEQTADVIEGIVMENA